LKEGEGEVLLLFLFSPVWGGEGGKSSWLAHLQRNQKSRARTQRKERETLFCERGNERRDGQKGRRKMRKRGGSFIYELSEGGKPSGVGAKEKHED